MKSEIDTVTYQWIATTNSTGCVNAAKVMVLKPDPQKQGRNKLTAFDTLRQFFAKINIADILLYTSNKISNIRSDLPYENLQSDKYSYVNIVAESKLLFFSVLCMLGDCLVKLNCKQKLFSNEIGQPIFRATTSYIQQYAFHRSYANFR